MLAFLVRRSILAFITLLILSMVTFVIVQLPPGDWVDDYIAFIRWRQVGEGTDEMWAAMEDSMRAQWGLDRPIHIHYLKWVRNMVSGNFGMSIEHNLPITEVLGDRILLTVILTLATVIFTWTMAIPIGIYSAVRQRSIEDYTFTLLGFIGLAVPDFMLALLMMYFAFLWFDLSPGGLFSREYVNAPWSLPRMLDLAQHLIIPSIILGTSGTASLIRILRANLLDELRRPYVVTARAKGLQELRVILKYPVRVALNPLISTVGYILPFLISGSVIVSVVLSLPTVGPILLQATLTQDMQLASLIILLLGFMTVIGTLISDLLLVVIDPRIRLESE